MHLVPFLSLLSTSTRHVSARLEYGIGGGGLSPKTIYFYNTRIYSAIRPLMQLASAWGIARRYSIRGPTHAAPAYIMTTSCVYSIYSSVVSVSPARPKLYFEWEVIM